MCWVLKREFVRAFILACKSDLKSNPGSHTQGTSFDVADGARRKHAAHRHATHAREHHVPLR